MCSCHDDILNALKSSLNTAWSVKKMQALVLLTRAEEFQRTKYWMCYKHLKNLASKLEMQTQVLNQTALNEQLRTVYQQCLDLEKLKTELQIYIWIQKMHCLIQSTDVLEIYWFCCYFSCSVHIKWQICCQFSSLLITALLCCSNLKV